MIICDGSFSVDNKAAWECFREKLGSDSGFGKVTVGIERSWRRGDPGVQSGSNIGESHIRDRTSREGGKGSSPVLHLKTVPTGPMDFQTKSRMAHLIAMQSAASFPGASPFSFQPPTHTLVPSPLEQHQVSSTVKGAILKTRQKPRHLARQPSGPLEIF